MSIVMLHTNYCLASTPRQSTLHMYSVRAQNTLHMYSVRASNILHLYSVRASNTFLSTRLRKIYLDEMQILLHKTVNNWNWIQTVSA